jgi:hypothetical protein
VPATQPVRCIEAQQNRRLRLAACGSPQMKLGFTAETQRGFVKIKTLLRGDSKESVYCRFCAAPEARYPGTDWSSEQEKAAPARED